MSKDDGTVREFDTGATRDTTQGKLEMNGFTHPMVMKQFAKYMNMNRFQSDGTLRASDNWQKGIPKEVYIPSLRRHHDDVWQEYCGFPTESGIIAALCGVMFNSMGLLLEVLKDRGMKLQDFDGDEPTPEMAKRIQDFNGKQELKKWIKEYRTSMESRNLKDTRTTEGSDDHDGS